jgi:hypothetical protein
VHDELGAAPQRLVGDGVHVADDEIRRVAGVAQGVGAAVDADEHRPEVPHVGPDDREVALVAGTAGDDERVAVAEASPEERSLDALGEHPALLLQIAHRVLGEALERLGDPSALGRERARELVGPKAPAGRQARTVAEDVRAADDERLALADLVEEVRPRGVDQADAALDERERAGVREATRRRRGDVDDDANAGLEQLLGRDAVEIGVVDDRDVVRREPLDEVLRAAIEPRGAGELDEAH